MGDQSNLIDRNGLNLDDDALRNDADRFLHDIVGHHLVLMLAQVRVWSAAAAPPGDDGLRWLDQTVSNALADLRRLAGRVRGHPGEDDGGRLLAWLSAIPAAVPAEVLEISVRTPAALPDDLDPRLLLLVERLVKEGLANAARHAPGTHVQVTVDLTARLTVEIANGGSAHGTGGGITGGSSAGVDGRAGGSGIAGLRAEVTACGGVLSVGPGAGSRFVLRADLPVPVPSHVIAGVA